MVFTAEDVITITEIDKSLNFLNTLIEDFLVCYVAKQSDSMNDKEYKLSKRVIKQIDSVIDSCEILYSGISTSISAKHKERISRLGYIRSIFSKVKEVWSIIRDQRSLDLLAFSEFIVDLIRIKEVVFLQTDKKKWDAAYLRDIQEQITKKRQEEVSKQS